MRLKKELKLFDVFVISTGAMISAGFFLLPAVVAAHVGGAVLTVYVLAAVAVLPALLSKAELATAMPRAGGVYYFLDRTLGPLVGTIGGIGTWLALVLKSSFALIGMGAYLGIVLRLPLVPTAIALTLVFTVVNVLGARQSSGLLRVLVVGVLVLLAAFVLQGLAEVVGPGRAQTGVRSLRLFGTQGADQLLAGVGLVFVSYVGLTKVVSLSEEVENPERNIPLGMILGLSTVTLLCLLGAFIMVAVLGADALGASLTPAADAAGALSRTLPGRVIVWLVVVAAVAAFASAANAGMLAASRLPLAMGRDRVLPAAFAVTAAGGAPVRAVLLTSGLMVAVLVLLDVEGVAKLAAALQLLLFGLLNVAVIVMRESRIEAYDPGFRSPFYPWTQLAGLVLPVILVAEMGWLAVLFTLGVTALCFGWYTYYAQPRIARDGAIYHVFERLGRRRFAGLDRELRDLMKEKGLRAEDPFDEVVARALVIDHPGPVPLEPMIRRASELLEGRLPATAQALFEGFGRGIQMGGTPVAHGAALIHTRLRETDTSELVLVRVRGGVRVDMDDGEMRRQAERVPIQAIFCLVSGESDPGRHLRILAQLAGRVEDEGFMPEWLEGHDEQDLKETLLRDDRFLSLKVEAGTPADRLIGHALHELDLPPGCLVALIRRYGEVIVPRGRTVLREGDRLTIIGAPAGIRELESRYTDG